MGNSWGDWIVITSFVTGAIVILNNLITISVMIFN